MTRIILVPFDSGERWGTVHMINSDDPKELFEVQTGVACPFCTEVHVYRFYDCCSYEERDGYAYEVYNCKCATCRRYFEYANEMELDIG